ncbi:MAG: GatB/YqeY domain-containing protein [Alphaproteobacteria bacterium]|nr:GatB/YqeY domain-containing protein [Alphaproteobacteria bacterium]
MRTLLNNAMKRASEEGDQRAVHTIRLILAAVNDRDVCERSRGNSDGIGEEEVVSMMEAMVRQRQDAIARYEESGRLDEAEQEREEIEIINRFLPRKMDEAQMKAIVDRVIDTVNPTGIREIPKVMAHLRAQYPGQMDFNSACKVVRARLT